MTMLKMVAFGSGPGQSKGNTGENKKLRSTRAQEEQLILQLKAELDSKYPTLTRGHVTVNATAVEDNAGVKRRAGAPMNFSARGQSSRGTPAMSEGMRSELEGQLAAKRLLVDSMAQRVKSSPDNLLSELRLLEAQMERAQRAAQVASEFAALKLKEAEEASNAAHKAREHASSISEQLQRCKQLLMDDDSMYQRDHQLVSELPHETSLCDESCNSERRGTDERGQGAKQPHLIVLELEGALFESLEQIPAPPLEFRPREDGGDVRAADGGGPAVRCGCVRACVRVCVCVCVRVCVCVCTCIRTTKLTRYP